MAGVSDTSSYHRGAIIVMALVGLLKRFKDGIKIMTRKRKPEISLPNLGFQGKPPESSPETPLEGILQAAPRPIDESLNRRRITALQHSAAKRYHSDHTAAFSDGPRGIDYSRRTNVHSTSAFHVNSQGLATAHWREATKFVSETLSADHATLLTLVVIDEIPASHAAKKLKITARNGIAMLRQCLDALAEFYAL